MERLYVQRKVEVWIEEVYKVEEINDDTINAAVNYDIDPDYTETLWETQTDLGPVEVYDRNSNLLLEKNNE